MDVSSAHTTALRCDSIKPIVEGFNLASTLPQGLMPQIDWWYKYNGIQDPESVLANIRPPRPGESNYSNILADLLAFASTWAYTDPATFAFMMAHQGMKDWQFYSMRLVNDPLFVVTTAYLMQSPKKKVSILCFRGTEPTNAINWLTDLSISTDRFLEGPVHGGILRNMMGIWPLVSMGLWKIDAGDDIGKISEPPTNMAPIDESDENRPPSPLKALYITGHSLGGAMAALATAHIWTNPLFNRLCQHLIGCYTYGAPMVAAPQLADVLEKKIGHLVFRHVYAMDVVPQLPPATTGLFQHFGQEYRSSGLGEGWMLSTRPVMQTPVAALLPVAGFAYVIEQFPALRQLTRYLPLSLDHHSPRYYLRTSQLSRGARA